MADDDFVVRVLWWEVNLGLRTLCLAAHAMAKAKGFWETDRNVGELLALMHSEISEALEEYRAGRPLTAIRLDPTTGKPEGFPIELADLLIRVFDLAGKFGINLPEAIKMKMSYNATRPHRHGGKLC